MQKMPKIVHQLWKDIHIPKKFQRCAQSVKTFHSEWEHKLWTDASMQAYVQTHHPDYFPIYQSYKLNIMRVDIFRYILMNDFGGLYCDLDFEFVRPYDYSVADLILSKEFDEEYGDIQTSYANYFFASVPGHPLWRDILNDLQNNVKQPASYQDVIDLSGPGLVTRIFKQNQEKYSNYLLTPRPVFSPLRVHGKTERSIYINSGVTYGFHRGAGTWKNRLSWAYWKRKLSMLFIPGSYSSQKIK